MSDYPALQNFLSAYFHQDWRVEHDAPDAVVSDFLDHEGVAEIAAVRADLARLQARDLDEPALGTQLRALGSEYDPSLDGSGWRDWLATLVERFA